MKQRIVSVVLVLCLCVSFQSTAYACQEEISLGGDVFAEEFAEVYDAMIALKEQEQYREGASWTDYEPYSDSKGYYYWKGGLLGGKRISAVGCVAFAFILSDEAFGSLPARMYAAGEFAFTDIKVGDILRVNNDTHTVIVLEVSDAGVVVAEGNISSGDHKGKVHWGRAISRAEVMRDTSHYITRYPEGYVSPDDPDANNSIAEGTIEGTKLTWNLTKAGTLTVSGRGAMPDFSSVEEQPWSDKRSQIRKIVIEDGVTSIGSCAFWKSGALGVDISPSVTTIGNSAFRGSSIISVDIPAGVKSIGDSAFRECQNLSLVTFSEGLETISQNAFRACTSLVTVALPSSLKEVGDAVFFECGELKSVTFAPSNERVTMGDNLFTRCYWLMNVTLPLNIDHISKEMFLNCQMLSGVEIPQGAESIGERAFASCSGLTAVIIPNSVTVIGTGAFSACPLTDIYFTGTEMQWNGIRKIGDTTVISKATVHYNVTPPADSDDDNNDDNNNNSNNNDNDDNNDNSDNNNNGDDSENNDNPENNNDNSGTGGNSGNDNKNQGSWESPGNGEDSGNNNKNPGAEEGSGNDNNNLGAGGGSGSGNHNPGTGSNLGSGDHSGSSVNPGSGGHSESGGNSEISNHSEMNAGSEGDSKSENGGNNQGDANNVAVNSETTDSGKAANKPSKEEKGTFAHWPLIVGTFIVLCIGVIVIGYKCKHDKRKTRVIEEEK